jgi:hypothetical protein
MKSPTEITRQPPSPEGDPCLFWQKTITPTDLVLRMHGTLVHRRCYERDVYEGSGPHSPGTV